MSSGSRARRAAAGFFLALAGCASGPGIFAPEQPAAEAGWRVVATADDRQRLRQWRDAWVQGLAEARGAGHRAAIEGEGALLQPDAALSWQAPPSGDYNCRVLKLGSKAEGNLDYVAYPAFHCRLEAEGSAIRFIKLTGSQRPVGRFLPDEGRRMIFLGTLQLGDETAALRYAHDRERNMAGVVERIGERRWRIALPFPHFESTIDLIELIPRG